MELVLERLGIVIVAAGSGSRFGGRKQFARLAGRPLLGWCLAALDRLGPLAGRVVVLPAGAENEPEWAECVAGLTQPVHVVAGGATRAESVRAGVSALGEACELVAVHDGARPLVEPAWALACAACLEADAGLGATIVARAATDTLKQLDASGTEIDRTLDRTRVACAETPQVCRRAALLAALADPVAVRFTDEAQALEANGWRTAVHLIDRPNPKVTHAPDLAIVEALMRAREEQR